MSDAWTKEHDFTKETHDKAKALVDEFQDRLEVLEERGAAYHPKWQFGGLNKRAWVIHTVNGRVDIEKGKWAEIDVSLNGSLCLKIVGVYLVGIKFDAAEKAISGIRAQMILDDLAGV